MLGKSKNIVVVKTKEQLKVAVGKKEFQIKVEGVLAKKLSWMGKISSLKIPSLIAALGSAVAMTVGGGTCMAISAVPVAAIAKVTGMEIATVILSCGLSVSLILAVLGGYTIAVQSDGILMERKN